MEQSARKPDNVTKFKKDRRLSLVHALRSLALLGMLATVIVAVWQFQEQLRIENLRQIWPYLRSLSVEGESIGGVYPFEAGTDTALAPFAFGLAVVSNGTYSYVGGVGDNDFSTQLNYSAPVIEAGQHAVLIYERGGVHFCTANTYRIDAQHTLDSPILHGSINADGDVCIVTNEQGYQSAVTLYEDGTQEVYKWQTPEYYVIQSSVSPAGDGFAALCLSEAAGHIETRIIGFYDDQAAARYTIELGAQQVYSIKHDEHGTLVAVCDDGVRRYDAQGTLLSQTPLSSPLLRYDHTEGQLPLLALRVSTPTGEQVLVQSIDTRDGTVQFSAQYAEPLRDLALYEDTAYLLFAQELLQVDLRTGDTRSAPIEQIGVSGILLSQDGRCMLRYSDRAVAVSFEN